MLGDRQVETVAKLYPFLERAESQPGTSQEFQSLARSLQRSGLATLQPLV